MLLPLVSLFFMTTSAGAMNSPVDELKPYLPQDVAHKVMGYAWDRELLSHIKQQLGSQYTLFPDGSLYFAEFQQEHELGGHIHWVGALAWSPDGKYAATGSDDHTVRIWDVATGTCRYELTDHTDIVRSMAWSHDGNYLATGSFDLTVRIWDVTTGTRVHILQGDSNTMPACSIAWSSDDKYIATGPLSVAGHDSYANTCIWDAKTGHRIRELDSFGNIRALAWSPGDTFLATVGDDQKIRIWDTTRGNCLYTVDGRLGSIDEISWENNRNAGHLTNIFARNGSVYAYKLYHDRKLISMNADGTLVCTLDSTPDSYNLIARYRTGLVYSASWSPDGTHVVTSFTDGTAYIGDADTNTSICRLSDQVQTIASVLWSHDGKRILTGSHEGIVRIWKRTLVRKLNESEMVLLYRAAQNGGAKQALEAIIEPRKITNSEFCEDNIITGRTASAVALNRDGSRMVIGCGDGHARIMNSKTGAIERVLKGHEGHIVSISWSPDDCYIATGSTDDTVRIWDSATGAGKQVLRGHHDSVHVISWHPNSKSITTGSTSSFFGEVAYIWHVTTGRCTYALSGNTHGVRSIASNLHNNYRVIVSGDGAVRLVNSTTGVANTIFNVGTVCSVAVSCNAERLATGSDDGVVRLWNVKTGRLEREFRGCAHKIGALAWSPQGSYLATSSDDGMICLWNSATGVCTHTLRGHAEGTRSLAWSQDGNCIITNSVNDAVRLWRRTELSSTHEPLQSMDVDDSSTHVALADVSSSSASASSSSSSYAGLLSSYSSASSGSGRSPAERQADERLQPAGTVSVSSSSSSYALQATEDRSSSLSHKRGRG